MASWRRFALAWHAEAQRKASLSWSERSLVSECGVHARLLSADKNIWRVLSSHCRSLIKLARAFKVADDDKSGSLSPYEFAKAMSDFGIGLTKEVRSLRTPVASVAHETSVCGCLAVCWFLGFLGVLLSTHPGNRQLLQAV